MGMQIEPKQEPTPRQKPNRKLMIMLSVVGIFVVTIGFTFVLSLIQIPTTEMSGPNLVVNPSFEKWNQGQLEGWNNNRAFVFKEATPAIHGDYAVGIYAKDSVSRGIQQKIEVNPAEVYNIYYCLRTESAVPDDNVGVAIQYEGQNVSTTVDVAPGVHYYDGKKNWRQYFGRFTGASSVTLRFFSKNHVMLLVDGVGVGINLMPINTDNDSLIDAVVNTHSVKKSPEK